MMTDLTIVQWVVAAVTSVFVAGLGYFQYRATKGKFVLDLFEKRYEVYSTIRAAVADITSKGKLDVNVETELGAAVERAYFFFGDDVIDYIKTLQTDINKLTILGNEQSALSGADLKVNVEATQNTKDRVFAFYREGQRIFAKYMRFDQKLSSPLFWTRRWHYGAIAFAIMVVAGAAFWPTGPDPFEVGDPVHNSAPISAEQQKRGKALRAEIDKLYADMKSRGALKHDGQGYNDITDTIVKYLPVGSSFDDAEAVLRAARCVIHYPSSVKPRRLPLPWDDDVIAQGVIEHHLLGTNLFDVNLTPQNPGEYTVVAKISARFDLRSL